jgi:hypothetical protein
MVLTAATSAFLASAPSDAAPKSMIDIPAVRVPDVRAPKTKIGQSTVAWWAKDDGSNGGKSLTAGIPGERSAEARCRRMIMMHLASGIMNRIPVPETSQTFWLPALHISFSAVLRLAALAALLPVLAMPLADATRADEITEFALVDCCARTVALLQDNAILKRSLSQSADTLAASEARADALAGKLLELERTASSLRRENTALRSRLEAPPSPEDIPESTAGSSQPLSSNDHTSKLSPDSGRIPYPATLPASGAQPSDQWHGRVAELACTHGGRIMGVSSSSAGLLQLRRCVRLHRVPSRPQVPRSVRARTSSRRSCSLACIRVCGP